MTDARRCRSGIEAFAVICHARLMWIADPERGGGAARMDQRDRMLVAGSLLEAQMMGGVRLMWRVNASLAGCRHEDETLLRREHDHADRGAGAGEAGDGHRGRGDLALPARPVNPCPNHSWSNCDHVARCITCGMPLTETDPAD
jgi:hypothetical protein